MADVERGNRPLSPHVFAYRLPLNANLSILHRATGSAVGFSVMLVVIWLVALASGPKAFAFIDWIATSWLGILVWLASLVSIWFHFAHGTRHLIWDTGAAYGKRRVHRSSLVALAFTAVMVVVTLAVAIVV